MNVFLDQTWVYEHSYEEIYTNQGYPWLCLVREQNFGSVLGFHLESWPTEQSLITTLQDAIFLEHYNQIFERTDELGVIYIPQKVILVEHNLNLDYLRQISRSLGFIFCALSPEEYLLQKKLDNWIYRDLDKSLLKSWKRNEIDNSSLVNRSKSVDIVKLEKAVSNFFFRDYNFRANSKTEARAKFECWQDCLSSSQSLCITKSKLEDLFTLK
jgi:hypothetical protein